MFKLTVFGHVLAAALLLVGCTATVAQSWTIHRDPLGFSVELPTDWEVRNESGRVTVAGPNMERVTIMPLRVEGQLDARRAQSMLVGLSGQLWPRQRWSMPRSGWQFGPNGVRAVGADESALRETTALWWANTPQGATLFFYGVAGQPARFQSLEPVFARILSSFRVTQASGGGQGGRGSDPLAGLQFQTWQDPTESAFSAEIPAGWRVSGGIRRTGSVGRRDEIVAQSPDGQFVRTNDASLPTQIIEPNQTLANLGYYRGMMYPGTNSPILDFMPPVNFAISYIQNNFGRACNNLQWLRRTERPDYVQYLAAQGLLTGNDQVYAGEVIYTCQYGNQPYVGYLFVTTTRSVNPGVGNIWNVSNLSGFHAPAGRATQADAVLQRIQASFRMNPQWWRANVGADMRILDNFQRYRAFSANLQQQTANERWASWERRTEQTGDILQNVTRVVDPQTGQPYKVQGGSNYYWIDPIHDVIAGTNIPYKPTWDFRELVQTYR